MTRTRTPKTKNPNREPTFTGGGLRLLLFIVVALQWTCGVVDLGLTAYFEGTWVWLEGFHAMFGIVLGCVSSYFYFVYMWCAFIRIYKGYFLLANLFFSHLWLAYFIFNAIDYNGKGGCAAGQPAGIGHCSTKYALEAFSFATFFFTVLVIPIDVLLFVHERRIANRVAAPYRHDEIKAESSGANNAV